jgi:hypothetical protein
VRDATATLQALQRTREAFWFTLGAYALLTADATRTQLSNYEISISNEQLSVAQRGEGKRHGDSGYTVAFGAALASGAAKSIVEQAFRQMILTTYELTIGFAKRHKLQSLITSEQWYGVARHYRNALAHSGRWHFTDNRGLPALWRSKVVDQTLRGQPVDGYLGWYDGLQMCAEMINFISKIESARET